MFDPLKAKTRLMILTAVAFVLGIGSASVMGWTSLTAMPSVAQVPQVSDADVRPALDLSDAFVNVSEAVTPAVVRIEADRMVDMASVSGLFDDPQFRQFFGDPRQQMPEPQPRTAGGTGFIVSEDGYILTNDHVVAEAREIRVFLADHREYTAQVVGSDPTTDVAVIKIDGQGLPTLSLGSSDDVRVGEWVLALGNPGFGGGNRLDYTVTAGIVSAKGRPLDIIQDGLRQQEAWQGRAGYAIEDFIQTDAVINPGNSGGPLVNMRGMVVGINSAIASTTGSYQGYGFAIPIELASRVMEDLVAFGEVRRARLGIEMGNVSPVDAEVYGLPRAEGALVQGVPEDGPAYRAGLRIEDVIVGVDGQDIGYPAQLQSAIAQKRPGEQVRIAYYRDKERREVTVRLDQADTAPRVAEAAPRETAVATLLGIEVGELDAAAARELGTQPGGVVIESVSPTSVAARAGVVPGTRIVEINREPVPSVEAAEKLLQELERGQIVTLLIDPPGNADGTRVVNIRVPM